MNRKEYMGQLTNELRMRHVPDIEDILAEYEQHFDFKLAEGCSEEEIANRLAKPAAIAEEFLADHADSPSSQQSSKVLVRTGLVLADVLAVTLYVLLWSWILVIGTFALAATVLGIYLLGNLNIAGLIPVMPYAGAVLFGISCLGLGVLSGVGTIYSYLYVVQWSKVYVSWHKHKWSEGRHSSDQTRHPNISNELQRRLRNISIISLLVFGLALLISMFYMFAYTGFKPFWHELGWFQY